MTKIFRDYPSWSRSQSRVQRWSLTSQGLFSRSTRLTDYLTMYLPRYNTLGVDICAFNFMRTGIMKVLWASVNRRKNWRAPGAGLCPAVLADWILIQMVKRRPMPYSSAAVPQGHTGSQRGPRAIVHSTPLSEIAFWRGRLFSIPRPFHGPRTSAAPVRRVTYNWCI